MCDLETTLSLLARHGRPSLSQMSNGWYCNVDMHVAAVGAQFKVASNFDCPGPLAAADQCLERIHTMLRSFGTDTTKAISHG